MIRHISMFSLHDNPSNGKNKKENIALVKKYLDEIPNKLPYIAGYSVGQTILADNICDNEAPVIFGDLVQIIDFNTPADALNYPNSDIHNELVSVSEGIVKKVYVIDFEI